MIYDVNNTPSSAMLNVQLKRVETLITATDSVAIGRFVCPSEHALYRDSGPCTHHSIVFPRTTTAIRRDDGRFVADPTTVVFLNQDQRYTRSKISDVDACDWFVFADDLLHEVLSRFDRGTRNRWSRPFAVPAAQSHAPLFVKQRRLVELCAKGELSDPLEIDEAAIDVLLAALGCAYAPRPRRKTSVTARLRTERAENAKRQIARSLSRQVPLKLLAASAGCSPFELCRSFRAVTGMTISQYRSSMRIRVALEMLSDPRRHDLAAIALDLGFSSHSHFSSRFREVIGTTPSLWRDGLPERWLPVLTKQL